MPGESTVHLLDVGTRDYGDALLCRVGGRTILIDGGHPGDERSGGGRAGLIDQLRAIYGGEPPFKPDLLIVSHAHLDHIGALPTMVSTGILEPLVALVADPDLGWGVAVDDGAGGSFDGPRSVTAAMREEPIPSDRDDSSLSQWIADAATLEDRYRTMLDRLRARGTTVIRHIQDSHTDLEKDWKDLKLDILGPTETQALVCADRIQRSMDSVDGRIEDLAGQDASLGPVELYRRLVATDSDAADAADRLGAAVNMLSIVVTFVADGRRVLLGGDMEFAPDRLPDSRLSGPLRSLRQRITKLAPYGFLKLAHHGSRNGVDAKMLDALGPSYNVGIVTGSGSENHPNAQVLGLLAARTDRLHWARTDRNGPSAIDLAKGGTDAFTISKGELDDERAGGGDVGSVGVPSSAAGRPGGPPAESAVSRSGGSGGGVTVRTTTGDSRSIDITVSVPVGVGARVALEVEPFGEVRASDVAPRPAALAGRDGGRLAGVLVVTASEPLSDNVGSGEARDAIAALEALGAEVLDLGQRVDVATASARTREALTAGGYRGTLILGGFDVVPAAIVDALPPELRARLTANDDPDDFRVFNDEAYGDLDGDGLAELPVSRLPDGRSSALLRRAVAAQPSRRQRSAAVRNLARPFAERVYSRLPGQRPMLISVPTRSRSGVYPLDADLVYLMLHGDWEEADVFEGEDESREFVRAIEVDDLGPTSNSVVFAGCCWGALTVDAIARDVAEGRRFTPRPPERSMALSFLAQGAQAFVGCTGVHYSPIDAPLSHYGEPMHQFFFEELEDSPAEALFEARRRYVMGIPHGPTNLRSQAIEYKIWRQFTCLGIGW
jgi:beta-lactamase superfamily II metal-dependent hydrolase